MEIELANGFNKESSIIVKKEEEEEYPTNKYFLLDNPCKVCIKLIIYSIALSILIMSFFVKKK
jgi:hypothetical protein